MTVYPHSVKSLSQDVWAAVSSRVRPHDHRLAYWVLDIAGPFCVWPKRLAKSGYADRGGVSASDMASRLLGVYCCEAVSGDAITVMVVLTGEDRDRLIRKVYERETVAR